MRFRYLLLTLGIIYGLAFCYYHRWDTNILYGGDSWGYYAYLPALFINGDLESPVKTYQATAEEIGYIPNLPEPGGEINQHDNGNYIIKYTCGVALMELPFFLIGHVTAGILGFAQNGYSLPYLFSVHLAVFFYWFIGLYLLYQVLRQLVKSTIAVLTIAVICLATNLHFFTVYSGTMSHAFLFALYAGLLYGTVKIYSAPKKRWAVLIGLSAGLITLIRPVELICLLIPLGYGITSRESLQERWSFLKKHWKFLVLCVTLFTLCGFPQLFYWKISTGQWLYYSYGQEEFYWMNPNFREGLFSYQNGWLVYAPVMILALVGLYQLRKHRQWLLPTLSFLSLHLYITYSWWCWYYINGFGSRPMVETYALLAIPLALFLETAFRKLWSRILISFLLIGFTALNLFQTYQTKHGILLSEFGNQGYYWSVFGKTRMDYGALVAFDSKEQQPDSSQLIPQQQLLALDFESTAIGKKFSNKITYRGQQALELDPWDSLEVLNVSLDEIQVDGDYLQVQAWCYKELKEWPWYEMPFIAMSIEREGKIRRYRTVRIDNKLGNPKFDLWGGKPNTWGLVKMSMHIPSHFKSNDRIRVFIKARRQKVFVDD